MVKSVWHGLIAAFLLNVLLAMSASSAAAATVTLFGEELPTEEASVIYVVDISGSMGADFPTFLDMPRESRLDVVKEELKISIDMLTPDFQFNIIAYDCTVIRWAPDRQPATPENKQAAATWIDGLTAMGGAATGPAVATALEDTQNLDVVILSDTAPNCGASGFGGHLQMISAANTQGAKLHTFGIAATGQFQQFLINIANQTGGNYIPIP